jgi:glycosyltransferase involved in cell wall biosynthesis
MRVLFLTPRPLVDPRSGGTIKSAAVLAHLEARHEVEVASFVAPGERWERASGRVVVVELDRDRSVGRLAASYLRGVPLSIERNRSAGMVDAVDRLVRDRSPDAVFVDGWLMARYVPGGFGGLAALHQHNAEHVMWRRHAELERNPLRRALVRLEADRVQRYEAHILGRFGVVFAVSEPDRAALLRIGAPPPVPLLPNVPAPGLLDRPALDPFPEPVLLSIGTLSWQPNVEGLLRFLRQGFPRLRQEVPNARLVIGGSGAPRTLVSLAASTPGVELVGEVHDDEALYRRARCFVDTGLGGAGTRVKLLNTFARGLPAAATPDAAAGLDAVPGEHVLLLDAASGVAPLIRLLSDDDVWRRLSERGRELIRARYLPDVAFRTLDDVFPAG